MKLFAEIFSKLRNKWRGWSAADLESLQRKLVEEKRPGAMIPLTRRESNALRDNPNAGLWFLVGHNN